MNLKKNKSGGILISTQSFEDRKSSQPSEDEVVIQDEPSTHKDLINFINNIEKKKKPLKLQTVLNSIKYSIATNKSNLKLP